jgi:hypothetical protein
MINELRAQCRDAIAGQVLNRGSAAPGRDQLALYDLATGTELARFDAPGGSSDLIALGSGIALRRDGGFRQELAAGMRRSRPRRCRGCLMEEGAP